MMFAQLLRAQIPKAQKIQSSHQSFFALLRPSHVKAACKTLFKLAPGATAALAAISAPVGGVTDEIEIVGK